MQLNLTWPEGITEVNVSVEFMQAMIDRMAMSYFKYGSMWDKDKIALTDTVTGGMARVEKYIETGNTEWLIDAANFFMIEFENPAHPAAHYRVTEGEESPGYALKDGSFTDVHKRDL